MAPTKKYVATSQSPPWKRSAWAGPTQKQAVYYAVADAGAEGISRVDISNKVNLAPDRVGFYLSELKRAGLVVLHGAPVDPATLNATDAAFYALGMLENALVARAKESGITVEMERSFLRYQKIKARALGTTFEGEMKVAVRLATIELVKLIF